MTRLLAINTHSPLSNLLRFVFIITLIFIFFPISALAGSGMIFNHAQNGGGSIEDNGGDDSRTIWEIDLSGAPADAIITGVEVEYWISHRYVSDLRVWLSTEHNGEWIEYILWNREGENTDNIHEKKTGLTIWNGLPANRKWYLSAADFAEDDEGEIEEWKIWVYYDSESSVTPQDFIYRQDFSLGQPGITEGWEYYSTNEGQIRVIDGTLRMDDSRNNSVSSLNEAILHLDLSGRSGVALNLDHISSGDEDDSLPANFTGHANGDGIAISTDGTKWYLVTNLTTNFNSRSFNLDTVVQSAGISYTSNFLIKFQQYDNLSWPEDGRAFDNISITTQKIEPVPENRPFGTWKGTFNSTNYRTSGTINNWIMRDDYITESTWELIIGSKSGIRINPSGTYSFNPLNGRLGFSYNGLATIWVDRQINNIPCIFDVNGTVFPNNASGSYIMRFFPPNLLPFSDSGTWQATQIPNVVLHILGIEICTGWNHNDPDKENDMTYDFYLGVETDNTVNQIDFLTPAGSVFNIPYDFHTESGGIETWHYAIGTDTSDISPTQLTAHWKMDDNSATTAVLDSSGNGNDGTARRNTTALTKAGIIDNALSFNGVNDYITIPKRSNLITGTNDFTIAGWCSLNKIDSIQNLIAWKERSSAVQFAITDGLGKTGIWAGSRWLMSVGYTFTTGTWNHIAWTRSGNVWKVYINGAQIGPDVINNYSLGMPILNYHIGAEATAPSQFLNGSLDDIKIYGRVLSNVEIKTLYDRKRKDAERWEYKGKLTNSAALTQQYGDGTYTITLYHKDGKQNQTTAWFGIPETTNAIPQPTKKPVLTFPKNNSKTISPVIFMWEPLNDTIATSIGLCVEKVGSDERCIIDNDFPISAISSNPISLGAGTWLAKLFWDHWYNYNNPEGIAVQAGKFSESDYGFEISSQVPVPDTTILVAHWKMDDNAATTTVLDSSSRGNNGAAQRQTSAMTAAGIIDNALSFNGTNDYIKIPKSSNLITQTNSFTITGWCSLKKIDSIQNLIAWKEPSSAVQFAVTDGLGHTGIWAGSRWLMSVGYTFTTSTWNHIAWTRDGNVWKVYINGTQIGPDVINNYSLGMPILDYHIGAEATTHSQLFNGLLDDVRIYNKALSGTEIKAMYDGQEVDNTQQGTKPTTTNTPGTVVVIQPGQGQNLIEQQIVPVKPEQTGENGQGGTTSITFPIPEFEM